MDRQKLFLLIIVAGIVLVLLASGCIKKKGEELPVDTPPGTEPPGDELPPGDGGPIDTNPVDDYITEQISLCLASGTNDDKDSCLVELAKNNYTDRPCNSVVAIGKDACLLEFAKLTLQPEDCSKISNALKEEECYYSVAISSYNYEICGRINNSAKSQKCIGEIASISLDVEACSKITSDETRYACFAEVGSGLRNAETCRLIPENYSKDGHKLRLTCYTNAGIVAPDVCLEYGTYTEFATCYDQIPREQRTIGLCEKVNGDDAKAECYTDVAKASDDYTICDNTPNSKYKESCYETLIDEDIVSDEFCDSLSASDTKDLCLVSLAGEGTSYDMCEEISKADKRYDCYGIVAVNNSDLDGCRKIIGDIGKKNSCLSKVAVKKDVASLCEEITISQYYTECFSEIAIATGTEQVCREGEVERFTGEKFKAADLCIKDYSVKAANVDSCDAISSTAPTLKEICKDEADLALLCKPDDGVCPEECVFPQDRDCGQCMANSDCEDGLRSTTNICDGSPGRCKSQVITQCINDDRYCPSFCTIDTDTDCLQINGLMPIIQFVGPETVVYPFNSDINFVVKNDSLFDLEKFYYKFALYNGETKMLERTYTSNLAVASGKLISVRNTAFLPEFGSKACTQYGYVEGAYYMLEISASNDNFEDDKGIVSQQNIAFTGACPA